MSKKLTYCLVVNELEVDDNFEYEAFEYLSKIDDNFSNTKETAVTGILHYWVSRGELECYLDGLPIYNHDDNSYENYDFTSLPNESLREKFTFEAQELIDKLKNDGFTLPDFLLVPHFENKSDN